LVLNILCVTYFVTPITMPDRMVVICVNTVIDVSAPSAQGISST